MSMTMMWIAMGMVLAAVVTVGVIELVEHRRAIKVFNRRMANIELMLNKGAK